MSIIIEIEDDEVFRLYNYYHEACFPHWKGGDIHKVERIEERHECWECQEWIEAEQEMQALDQALVPSEEERSALLEPTPYDAGVCKCGEPVAAGRLHAHRCPDPVREMRMIESETWKRYLEGDLDPRKREF